MRSVTTFSRELYISCIYINSLDGGTVLYAYLYKYLDYAPINYNITVQYVFLLNSGCRSYQLATVIETILVLKYATFFPIDLYLQWTCAMTGQVKAVDSSKLEHTTVSILDPTMYSIIIIVTEEHMSGDTLLHLAIGTFS